MSCEKPAFFSRLRDSGLIPRPAGFVTILATGPFGPEQKEGDDMTDLDESKIHGFVGRVLGDLGGAASVPLVRIGHELGLYAALHEIGPATPEWKATWGKSEQCIASWSMTCSPTPASAAISWPTFRKTTRWPRRSSRNRGGIQLLRGDMRLPAR